MLAVFSGGLPPVNRQPARVLHNLAFGLKRVLLDAGESRGDLKLRRREKNTDETPDDHVVNFLLRLIETVGRRARRNDGKMVGDLCVIEDALGRLYPIVFQRVARVRVVDLAQRRFDCREIILGQEA